jgi:hypothetical protein
MPQFDRHFSLQEANDLLPQVLSVFERVNAIRDDLGEDADELDALHESSGGNGGSRKGSELLGRSESIAALLGTLEKNGIVIKDLNGLVDFPHMRDGREVFLCWKLGEKSITHWHEIDAGYKGRQPL